MSKTRQEKRSKIKPFIKAVNYNHLMPTRYTLELEGLKGALSADTFKEVSQREDAKKNVKKVLEERYTSGKNRWFFTPLSTSTSPQSSRSMIPHIMRTPNVSSLFTRPRRIRAISLRCTHPLTQVFTSQSSKSISQKLLRLLSFRSLTGSWARDVFLASSHTA